MVTSLREQTAATARKTKELEAFTYSVAHDLKGPLREIEGILLITRKRFLEGAMPKPATTSMSSAGRRRASLIYDRRAAQIFAIEQQDLPRQRFNVLEMITTLDHRPVQRDCRGQSRKSRSPPFADLYGEPVSIRQAIANLLDNAAKFSRRTPVPTITIGGSRADHERIL